MIVNGAFLRLILLEKFKFDITISASSITLGHSVTILANFTDADNDTLTNGSRPISDISRIAECLSSEFFLSDSCSCDGIVIMQSEIQFYIQK